MCDKKNSLQKFWLWDANIIFYTASDTFIYLEYNTENVIFYIVKDLSYQQETGLEQVPTFLSCEENKNCWKIIDGLLWVTFAYPKIYIRNPLVAFMPNTIETKSLHCLCYSQSKEKKTYIWLSRSQTRPIIFCLFLG